MAPHFGGSSTRVPWAQTEGGHLEPLSRGPSSQRQQTLKQRSFTSPHWSNQLSQDWVRRTDSQSVTSTHMCGPRRLPGCSWDSAGPGLFRSHSRPQPLSALLPPEAGVGGPAARTRHPARTGGAAENEHAISLPPWAQPRGEAGRQEHSSREIRGSLSRTLPRRTVPSGSRQERPRLHACQDPTWAPGPGLWGQGARPACAVVPPGDCPASGLHPRRWAQQRGLSQSEGRDCSLAHGVTARAQQRGAESLDPEPGCRQGLSAAPRGERCAGGAGTKVPVWGRDADGTLTERPETRPGESLPSPALRGREDSDGGARGEWARPTLTPDGDPPCKHTDPAQGPQ